MSSSKKSEQPWDLSDLVDSLRRSVEFSYELQRKNEGKDIPWSGPILSTNRLISGCDNIRERLSEQDPEELRYANKQPDAINRILICAVQLGIEQGFRILMRERYMRRMEIRDMKYLIEILESAENPEEDEVKDAISAAKSSLRSLERHIEDPGIML